MIVIGYQGIGKSTLCNNNKENLSKFIDLESGSFWDDNGKRPDDWYVYYCNIAEHLSKQNCIVFVSSHEVVRNRLKNSKEKIVCVVPSIELKDAWIKRLEERYLNDKSEKNYKAWMNAVDRYEKNIEEIKSSSFPYIEIKSMDYSLKELVVDYEINLISHQIKNDE